MKIELHNKVKFAHVVYGMLINTISIFGFLFFYEFFDSSIFLSFLITGLVYLSSGILVQILKGFLPTIGTSRAVGLAMISFLGAFGLLINIDYVESNFAIGGFVLLFSIGRALYMSSYQINLVGTLELKKAGRNMGILISLMAVSRVFVPLITGVLTEYIGSATIFVLSCTYALIVAIIYIGIPNIVHKSTMNITMALKDKTTRSIMRISFWDAIFNLHRYPWTLLIFIFWGGHFDQLGVFVAGLTLLSAILSKFLGEHIDGSNKNKSFNTFRLIGGLSILPMAFATSALVVFFADLVSRVTTYLFMTSQSTIYFSQIKHKNQIELIDDRAGFGVSTYDIIVGIVTIVFGLFLTVENIYWVFLFISSLLIVGYLRILKIKLKN
jgi:hypothetical protein